MEHKVKCRDCGLVALRLADTRVFSEVEFETRQDGRIPLGPAVPTDSSGSFLTIAASMGPRLYDPCPSCMASAHNLEVEFKEMESKHGPIASLKNVLNDSRTCPAFVKWQPGCSPQEHAAIRETERARIQQRRDNRINLAVAIIGPLVVSIFAAWINSMFSGPAVVIQQVAPQAQATATGNGS